MVVGIVDSRILFCNCPLPPNQPMKTIRRQSAFDVPPQLASFERQLAVQFRAIPQKFRDQFFEFRKIDWLCNVAIAASLKSF